MVKGFVFYRGGKIPFVIEDYRMELFSDDSLLSDFAKEHNFKMNYTLNGQYFRDGFEGQRATFLVEYSMAGTCYLTWETLSDGHRRKTAGIFLVSSA